MKPVFNHSWNLSKKKALELQIALSEKVVRRDQFHDVKLVAGVDVAYEKNGNNLVATVVIMDAKSLKIIESVVAKSFARFPYITGLFSFREIPPLIDAFAKLQHTPDIVVCDGQGVAHPRRFGLACHLGVLFDIPTIGCGKTKLIGEHEELSLERGSFSDIFDEGEVVGRALRTQNSVKPIYVSVGHRISLETASHWALELSPRYRLPETTRVADQLVKATLDQKVLNFQ